MNCGIDHIAIIMDGNGRWAKERGLPRLEGHKAGVDAAHRTMDLALKHGVKYLTLYAFSTENWKRPKLEVNGLMRLLKDFLDKQAGEFHEKGVRLRAIGRRADLPLGVRRPLEKVEKLTKGNDRGEVIMALSYGSRAEIADAAAALARDAVAGKVNPDKIDERLFGQYLYAPDVPDPDLMIRSSGEKRLSNFLLWQLSYSELYITDRLWPDFSEEDFLAAVAEFHRRKRRFGGV